MLLGGVTVIYALPLRRLYSRLSVEPACRAGRSPEMVPISGSIYHISQRGLFHFATDDELRPGYRWLRRAAGTHEDWMVGVEVKVHACPSLQYAATRGAHG